MRVISIANHKGGVGKTTSVVSIGAGLAEAGRRVLLIDLDPQANLTQTLGVNSDLTIYRSMREGIPLSPVEVTTGLSVVPSEFDLSGVEVEIGQRKDRNRILRSLIVPLTDRYDYILIDTPPSLGLLSINALTASTEVYIPLDPSPLALNGTAKLTGAIAEVRQSLNPDLRISGVIITKYDNRQTIQREIADTISQAFGDRVFKTRIRNNVALLETPTAGVDIFRYSPRSNGAKDYRDLCQEILSQE